MKNAWQTLQTCVWNATFRRPVSMMLFLALFVLIWFVLFHVSRHVDPDMISEDEVDWEAEYEKVRVNGLREHMSFYIGDAKSMKPVPMEWTARDRCPACFGVDMCQAIEKQELLVQMPQEPTAANKKGVYLGRWNDIPVAVKRLSNWYPTEFESFDKFICRNVTGSDKCNISAAVVSSNLFIHRPNMFQPQNLYDSWQISYPQVGAQALTYMMCLTPHILQRFSNMYGNDTDGALTNDQRAMLFTSMVVQPESLMLKFLRGIQFQRLAPRVYGACGRLVVVEHGGQLLASYLNSSFSDRAELGLQLLSLVQVLWHADRRWFAMYNDFDFDNIAVSHEKEIFLVDYEELNVIENTDFDETNDEDKHEEHHFGHNTTCNHDCFDGLLSRLASPGLSAMERHEHCESLHSISGNVMYANLCRNILSDDDNHRKMAASKYRGLLHSIPEEFSETKELDVKLSAALAECVRETSVGGRVKAVNDIADILSMFVQPH